MSPSCYTNPHVPGPSSSQVLTPATKTYKQLMDENSRLTADNNRLQKENEMAKKNVRRLQKNYSGQKATTRKMRAVVKQLRAEKSSYSRVNNIFATMSPLTKHFVMTGYNGHRVRKYPPFVRKFAMDLSYYSSKAYTYVSERLPNSLPHLKTMSSWLKAYNGEPGFTGESFDMLKELQEKSDKPLFFNIVFDEISALTQTQMVGNKCYGKVDLGPDGPKFVCGPKKDKDLKFDDMASEALYFMAVGVNIEKKVDLGWFPCQPLNAVQKKHLLDICLHHLIATKVKITGVTFDGAKPNVKLCKDLGCPLKYPLKNTTFIFEEQEICILPDAVHGIKNMRNALADTEKIVDLDGGEIKWNYIFELVKLQEHEGLHCGNKVRKVHAKFKSQKMKVKLATQVFSRSVADALEFLMIELCEDYPEFLGCDATIKFIRNCNDMFDILNTRGLLNFGFKRAINLDNYAMTMQKCDELIEYFSTLKYPDGQLVVESTRATGILFFINFIIPAQSLFYTIFSLVCNTPTKTSPAYF